MTKRISTGHIPSFDIGGPHQVTRDSCTNKYLSHAALSLPFNIVGLQSSSSASEDPLFSLSLSYSSWVFFIGLGGSFSSCSGVWSPDMSNSTTLCVALLSLSLLFFCLCREANSLPGKDKNKLVVDNTLSGKSQEEGSVECEKGLEEECEEGGKDEIEERVFEAGDYIYTNSNP